jgi:branched-subunit amino acid aminotransferase/4-amino-4-deoxychorismate lyase
VPALPAPLTFLNGVLTEHQSPKGNTSAERLAVADSWLVADGRVRALDLHRERFAASAAAHTDLNPETVAEFWDAFITVLPRTGLWFPRAEVIASGPGDGEVFRLQGRIRPAPVLGTTVVLGTHADKDPRMTPGTKGPDLERLLEVRDEAMRQGTEAGGFGVGEVVITSSTGLVIDGTTSAILWWRGDRLFAPSAGLTRVDSVTAKTLRLVAAATGVAVGEETARLADLTGCEIWAVNALHGIRLVTRWQDGPAVKADLTRSTLWRRRLEALARPLP